MNLKLQTFDLFINQTFLFLEHQNLKDLYLHMDLILIFIGFLLILLGLVGSFVPVIPGPITAWLGLLILYQTSFLASDFYFLAITFTVAIGVFILDYFIPMIRCQKIRRYQSRYYWCYFRPTHWLIISGASRDFLGYFYRCFYWGTHS